MSDDERERLRAEVAQLRERTAELEIRVERAEHELQESRAESEEKVRMAVDAAGVGLWTWDPARDELVWDAALSAIFGWPAGTYPTTRDGYFALIHPDDRERAAVRLADGMTAGRWEDEYRVFRADGAVRWVMAKKSILRDGERTRVIGAVIDVTERRERDEKLRQAQKLEAVGQLTAGIAHNFNNMLMGVIPNLDLARRRAPAELLPLLESASHSARRAADLVSQLMTYAGRNRPAVQVAEDVTALVWRAVDLCRTTFDRRIAFDETYHPGAGARVDASQIEQAVLNVLINARDALESTQVAVPRISVSIAIVRAGASELAGHDGDHVVLRIGDNGKGMDAATVAHVYEPFFTTKDVGKGTGLGLATTHAIVREHGGFITCESVRGEGTTFRLYLPYEVVVPRTEPPVHERAPLRGTETVLVVDDEPGIRHVVSLMLRSAGYVAREAASGSEALALLGDRALAAEVALVLLDVSMPGLPRGEIRSRLRELTRARLVYFTGNALDPADAEAADAVLQKPVTADRLLGTIRRVLDGSR
jgi:two-component system cell cycle sensor histidine kinase/response regulator CckA